MKRQTALITGASRGIGRAAATAFAKGGYDLVLNCARAKDELSALADSLTQTYSIQTLCCCGDIGDYAFVREMFGQIHLFCQGPDVLINNAGISYIGLLSETPYESWERLLRTNLTGVFSCCKFAIPSMVKKKSGKIINISSDWGICGASCEAAYSATKGGVNAFTKALAKELAPSNIQVNAVACGVIDTDMNACFSQNERSRLEEEIPAGYFAKPEEVARFLFELAQAPAYLTGQIISFDGGWI